MPCLPQLPFNPGRPRNQTPLPPNSSIKPPTHRDVQRKGKTQEERKVINTTIHLFDRKEFSGLINLIDLNKPNFSKSCAFITSRRSRRDNKAGEERKDGERPCSSWEVHREMTVSFLFPLPATLSLFMLNNRHSEHLVAVILKTKLFFTLAVPPQSIFFFIKGTPKQNTNKVLLTFYNGNKTRPGSYPPTGLFRWTHFTSILQLGERKLKGEFKLKRKGKEGRGEGGPKALGTPFPNKLLPSSNQQGLQRVNCSKSLLVINWNWVQWLLQAARLACRRVYGSHMAQLA